MWRTVVDADILPLFVCFFSAMLETNAKNSDVIRSMLKSFVTLQSLTKPALMLTTSLMVLMPHSAAFAFCPLCVFGAGVGAADAVRTGDMYRIGVWTGGFVLALIYYLRETDRFPVLNAISSKTNNLISNRYVLLTSAAASCVVLLVISSACGITYGLAVPILKNTVVNPEAVTKTGIFVLRGGIIGIVEAFAASYAACLLKNILPFRIPFLRLMLVLSVLVWLG